MFFCRIMKIENHNSIFFSCVINDCFSKRIDYCIINYSRVMDTARSVLLAYLVSLIPVRNKD